MEVLGHMQQQLEDGNRPTDPQPWVYRYVMTPPEQNKLIKSSVLGITMFALDIYPQFIPYSIFNPVQIGSYSLSVATTTLSTVIIVIRILMVSRMPGASRQPRVAMEIVVESAALYSISALVFTPMSTSAANGPTATYGLYAESFFAYMAVASHLSCLPVLIF